MINPHFLFNTLNSISSLIFDDPNKAEDTIQKLSSLFRRILNTRESEFHELKEELSFIEDYLRIEKVRLGDKLQYKINTEKEIEGTLIPALLLQPLVENAIIHGISKLKNGGQLDINCSKTEDNIIFEISNTLDQNVSPNNRRFGISGFIERLDLHFGNSYTYETTNTDGIYRVKLILPEKRENAE